MAVKDMIFAAAVCKKCSAEQLHVDGLTIGKGADNLPLSVEVTAVTAYPNGVPGKSWTFWGEEEQRNE